MTPIGTLSAYAVSLGSKPAVIDDRPGAEVVTWSFHELNRKANQLAHRLLELGVVPGDKVIWCGPNSPPVFAMAYAAQKINAVAVPLNYRLAPDEAAYVIDDSDAVV